MTSILILRGVYASDGSALVIAGQPAICVLQLTMPNPLGYGPDVPQDLTGRAFAQYLLNGDGSHAAEAAGQNLAQGEIRFTLDSATIAALLTGGATGLDLTHELVELVTDGLDVILLSAFSIRTARAGAPTASFVLNTDSPGPTPLIVRYAGAPGADGTGQAPSLPVVAAQDLGAAQFVAFGPDGAILADATDDTRPANGFILTDCAQGDTAAVFLPGAVNNALIGLTPGVTYFLGFGGAITSVRPVGGALQIVGAASDASHLVFHPGPITLL